jgi:hypothetical protein
MTLRFRHADEPDPRPAVCPKCGRGPGDYPAGTVRTFVIHWPAECGLKELPLPEPDEPGAEGTPRLLAAP